jgi:hypothetical protein
MKYLSDGKLLAAKKPLLGGASELSGPFRHVPGVRNAGNSVVLKRLIKPPIEYL